MHVEGGCEVLPRDVGFVGWCMGDFNEGNDK